MTQPRGGAREPDAVGVADRDGVRLAWKSYGNGGPALLLLPTWQIIDSRFWKAQVGYLSRHHQVVTYDGRGTGASSLPQGSSGFTTAECAADVTAVMDAAGLDSAVLVALSCGAAWAVTAAAEHPERVLGVVAIAPSCDLGVRQPAREQFAFDAELTTTRGWAKYNRDYWLHGDFADFREFFFHEMCSEPHSTKQFEDLMEWSDDTAPDLLVEATFGRIGGDGVACEPLAPACARVTCPVLVMHGTEDRITSPEVGKRLAELTGASLVLLEGSGHSPLTRDPVRVNLQIRQFVESLAPPTRRHTRTRAGSRRPRALYLSSPIGLGHARRDLAIAGELRQRHPDLQIDWLSQHPVTRMLHDAGETIHPGSAWLASESAHIEHEAGEHDLHAFEAIRRMDAILVNNFMFSTTSSRRTHYDLVDRRRGLGRRPLPAREPRAQAVRLRLDDRLRGLAADARRRRPRGAADRRLQLRDDRAAGAVPQSPRRVDVRRHGRRHGRRLLRARPARHQGLDGDNFDFSGYVTGSPPVAADERAALRASPRLPRRPAGLPRHRRRLRSRHRAAGPGAAEPFPSYAERHPTCSSCS